jgi:hypothetical protein
MENIVRSAVIRVSGGTSLEKRDWPGVSWRIPSTKILRGIAVGGDDGRGEVGWTQ